MTENEQQPDFSLSDPLAFSRAGDLAVHTVSPKIFAQSRKNHDVFVTSMEKVGFSEVARQLGVHPSAISRWKGDDYSPLARMCRAAAIVGLKLVPVDAQCFIKVED